MLVAFMGSPGVVMAAASSRSLPPNALSSRRQEGSAGGLHMGTAAPGRPGSNPVLSFSAEPLWFRNRCNVDWKKWAKRVIGSSLLIAGAVFLALQVVHLPAAL